MSGADGSAQDRISQWREAFDRSFAEPAALPAADLRDFLGIRIAGRPYALALDALAGLQSFVEPTPYPGDTVASGLLGLIAAQGQVLPLYDLRALLGLGAATTPRWLVITKAAPLALAFEAFEGQWRLSPADRLAQAPTPLDPDADAGLLDAAVRCDGPWRPTIALALLIARLGGQQDGS